MFFFDHIQYRPWIVTALKYSVHVAVAQLQNINHYIVATASVRDYIASLDCLSPTDYLSLVAATLIQCDCQRYRLLAERPRTLHEGHAPWEKNSEVSLWHGLHRWIPLPSFSSHQSASCWKGSNSVLARSIVHVGSTIHSYIGSQFINVHLLYSQWKYRNYLNST